MAATAAIDPLLLSSIMDEYTGDTDGAHLDGQGSAVFASGNTYTGSFKSSMMDGHGCYQWADGVRYTGELRANEVSGDGTLEWPDGAVYTGQLHAGLRHGRGVYRCARSAVRYEGDWVHGLRQGHGVIEFSGSACEPGGCVASYDGNWQHNRKNGRGRFQYASGNVYDGDWLDDVKHGHGRMHWRALHEVYVGNWHNGQPHGQGAYYWLKKSDDGREEIAKRARRNYYEGEFFEGKRQGRGTMHYADGSVYVGMFVDNLKHDDAAVFIYADGRVYRGAFDNDRIQLPSGGPAAAPGSSPLPTPGRPLPSPPVLHIDDLLPGSAADVEREQVEHVVLRHLAQLRELYTWYSQLGSGAARDDDSWLLSRLQLSQMLADCAVPSRRLDAAALLDVLAPACRHAAEAGLLNDLLPDPQQPDQTLLFRQFLEGLVRIAQARFALLHGSLPDRLSHLLSQHLLAQPPAVLQDRGALHERRRGQLLDVLAVRHQQQQPQATSHVDGDAAAGAAWLRDRPLLPADLADDSVWVSAGRVAR
eukprot:TRINITY_DN1857_c0_g2_i7.p1 TRINITY_DN1857_c0_g2~~TRINITY_DN1857_c0_g2_i7.p1  ORF type:complete len:559 (+),score=189.02 TRINITY_DN1857_c0_g2_i7:83-1678(+)